MKKLVKSAVGEKMIQITKVNIGIQEEEEVLKVLRSGGLAQGHVTAELESTFSKRF